MSVNSKISRYFWVLTSWVPLPISLLVLHCPLLMPTALIASLASFHFVSIKYIQQMLSPRAVSKIHYIDAICWNFHQVPLRYAVVFQSLHQLSFALDILLTALSGLVDVFHFGFIPSTGLRLRFQISHFLRHGESGRSTPEWSSLHYKSFNYSLQQYLSTVVRPIN